MVLFRVVSYWACLAPVSSMHTWENFSHSGFTTEYSRKMAAIKEAYKTSISLLCAVNIAAISLRWPHRGLKSMSPVKLLQLSRSFSIQIHIELITARHILRRFLRLYWCQNHQTIIKWSQNNFSWNNDFLPFPRTSAFFDVNTNNNTFSSDCGFVNTKNGE